MIPFRRLSLLAPLAVLCLSSGAGAQGPSVRPYLHAGVGLGRFVFLCSGCGNEDTSVVPSLSLGVSFRSVPLDVGLDALNWSHVGDRYTVLTAGTTFRPRGIPLFIGTGLGLAIRQYAAVCQLCTGNLPGSPIGPRGSETDPAMMVQVGGRIAIDHRMGIEPFAQYSRLWQGSLSVGHADHLAVGLRLDGR